MAITLPKRKYFTFPELMERWQCTENDIRHLIIEKTLVPSYFYKGPAWLVRWKDDEITGERNVVSCFDENGDPQEEQLSGFYYLGQLSLSKPFEGTFHHLSDERGHLGEPYCYRVAFDEDDVPRDIPLSEVMRVGVATMEEVGLIEQLFSEGPHKSDAVEKTLATAVLPDIESDIDPADLPEELDAANIAFRFVSNGYGVNTGSFRARLIDYVKKEYPHLKEEAVRRIATVANNDKAPGRKKLDTK